MVGNGTSWYIGEHRYAGGNMRVTTLAFLPLDPLKVRDFTNREASNLSREYGRKSASHGSSETYSRVEVLAGEFPLFVGVIEPRLSEHDAKIDWRYTFPTYDY
jgi:hypothetical protein